jgi:peptidoglycan/LPS O-acetylase OafA/YrhL
MSADARWSARAREHEFRAPQAAAIYQVSVSGRLASLTLGRVLQYLGRISYSLYLVHMLVGTPLVRFGLRHLGRVHFTTAVVLTGLAVAVSVAAAHVLYVVIERPAMRWSRRLPLRSTPR